jgi:hypothetical protein
MTKILVDGTLLYVIQLVNLRNDMANKVAIEKKVMVVSMLCEGASIRGIERMTGVNQDTITLGFQIVLCSQWFCRCFAVSFHPRLPYVFGLARLLWFEQLPPRSPSSLTLHYGFTHGRVLRLKDTCP